MPDAGAVSHVQLIPTDDPARSEGSQLHLDQASPATATFFLGQAFLPVPPKLVKKIQTLEFLDMADLLTDNLELLQRRTLRPQALISPPAKGDRVKCLTFYLGCSVLLPTRRSLGKRTRKKARDLLAYLRLIVREAQTRENEGWREYDVALEDTRRQTPRCHGANRYHLYIYI